MLLCWSPAPCHRCLLAHFTLVLVPSSSWCSSQNGQGWKGPPKAICSNLLLTWGHPEQVAQDRVQEAFGDPQGGGFRSLSGQSQNSLSLSPAISWVASQAANSIAAGPGAVQSCSFCLFAHPDVVGFSQDITSNGLGCFYLHGSLGSFPCQCELAFSSLVLLSSE